MEDSQTDPGLTPALTFGHNRCSESSGAEILGVQTQGAQTQGAQ